jgi:hypothetical protein
MHRRALGTGTERGDGGARAVRRLFERVYSTGELSFLDELVAPGFVGYGTDTPDAYHGPEGLREHVVRLRSAFFGPVFDLDEIDRFGNTWAATWTARGTHERPFLGAEPTCVVGRAGEEPHGRRVAVPGVSRVTVVDGRIDRHRMTWEEDRLRAPLGRSTVAADGSGTPTG